MRLATKPPRTPAVTARSKEVYDVTRKAPSIRIVLTAAITALVLVLVPTALADKGGNGGGKGSGKGGGSGTTTASSSSTTSNSTNSWAWQSPGSWGLPGQQLTYAIQVFNNDLGCGSSSFVVGLSAPSGFSVSMPTTTITLSSASGGYLWAYVTSPTTAADGDYPLTVTASRTGASAPAGSSTSYYKVYSSDTVAPKQYLPSPTDGATISGRYWNVGVASSDDHAVKQIDLYIDNVYTSTTFCGNNTSYECRSSYKWAIRRVHGLHTATFKSSDWMGNVSTLTVTFTVN